MLLFAEISKIRHGQLEIGVAVGCSVKKTVQEGRKQRHSAQRVCGFITPCARVKPCALWIVAPLVSSSNLLGFCCLGDPFRTCPCLCHPRPWHLAAMPLGASYCSVCSGWPIDESVGCTYLCQIPSVRAMGALTEWYAELQSPSSSL